MNVINAFGGFFLIIAGIFCVIKCGQKGERLQTFASVIAVAIGFIIFIYSIISD
ncbi:hypothetical protein LCGC14_0374630 [marine sediment metagenome]|uniref:Uncharacterized protein n=1 Tax=marine sediment metagenome TaxID=412755 RepID=A0A0F9WCY7_9ZZZZ